MENRMEFDVVIRGGRVIDPETGLDGVRNVGITGAVISAVTEAPLCGRIVLDAAGLVVSPGFIDIHTHEDTLNHSGAGSALPIHTSAAALKTGNTTIVTGNCGLSSLPVSDYSKALREADLPIHCPFLVGNVALRYAVGLDNYTPASPDQIVQMVGLAEEAFRQGAIGISFGLQYAPGTSEDELTALCQAAADADKFMAVHMRYDYPEKAEETLVEIISAAERTGVKTEISHLAANIYGEGNIRRAAELIGQSTADIMCDVYPYNAWGTSLQSAVFDEGFQNFNFNVEDLEIVSGEYAGTYCTAELFDKLRKEPEEIRVVCHNAMPIQDVEAAYCLPFVSVGSDGQMQYENGEYHGHPRGSSSPVKFLAEFVRDKNLMPLAEGIRKLTYLPALRCGFDRKGRIQAGMDADITIFDYDKLKVNAAFGTNVCNLPPDGIRYVLTDGTIAYQGR
ncbi:amidohydrolase family protein [Anaerolentibacter hominis]|uniref:amidohydrolase family protein n=1 Tax=Anaerolentibacter hominis TaxID=3079009 RepID=UPI0031B86D3C